MDELTNIIITSATALISSIGGYFVGFRKRTAEENKAIFETYNFAIQSLRDDFFLRVESMKTENEELKKQIKELKEENEELKKQIKELKKQINEKTNSN